MKIFLMFVLTTVMFALAISGFRSLTGKEKWKLTKLFFYGLFCSFLSAVTLTTIVVLF